METTMLFNVIHYMTVEFMHRADFTRFDFVKHCERSIDEAAKMRGATGTAINPDFRILVPTNHALYPPRPGMITLRLMKNYQR
jgi:hypothetical protein